MPLRFNIKTETWERVPRDITLLPDLRLTEFMSRRTASKYWEYREVRECSKSDALAQVIAEAQEQE